MAPIEPNQLLTAFAPLLTSLGGIKNVAEVPRLSSLMKKFSRKLVSRCVYCNILLATNCDVLEEFLKSGGWETIHLWIKSAKDLNNKPFLDELLKLLMILPMNVQRLRENDSPKMIKSLSKGDDQLLAVKAKQIVEKWTKMIEMASGVKGVKDNNINNKKEHKKRKKDNSFESNSDNKNISDIKRLKTITSNVSNDVDMNDDVFLGEEVRDKSNPKPDRIVRPVTVKVKPGKSRLEGLVSAQTNMKSVSKTKKESLNSSSKKLVTNISNSETQLIVAASSVSKGKTIGTEIKPMPATSGATITSSVSVTPPPPAPPTVKHILHESTSFMDALLDTPMSQVKKKRRPSASVSTKDPTSASVDTNTESTSSPKASPPKVFSFYKDMIDEKMDQKSDSNAVFSDDSDDNNSNDVEESDRCDEEQNERTNEDTNNDEMANHMSVDIPVPEISVDPSLAAPTVIFDRSSSLKLKSILCIVKKGDKKSVRWVDENPKKNIQTVRLFELDETERVNVNRPPGASTFGDFRRFDMRHEAELMLMARRSANTFDVSDDYSSRAHSFGVWHLIPCDGDNLIDVGKESKERWVQADRMRTILETFYTRNQIPESAQEPDPESHYETEPMKVIPLDDENNPNNYHDFSKIDLPQPKTGEVLPPRLNNFVVSQPPIRDFAPIVTNQFPTPGPQHMHPNSGFADQPLMPPFVGPALLPPVADPFSGHVPSVPLQQFFPQNGPSFQQWPDNASGGPPGPPHSGPPPPQHFMPPFGGRGVGARPPRLPRNAQNTVCKHFARTGKCRFQPRCNFLHSNDR